MQEFVLGWVFKTRITVSDDSISGKGTFTNWSYPRSVISGYRLDNKQITLYKADDKVLKSISRDSGSDDFISWLRANYPDLNRVAREKEEREILSDETFGQDETERSINYKLARRIVYGLTALSGVILVASFFTDDWQWLLFTGNFAILLASAIFYRKYRGLIRILSTKAGAYPAFWGAYLAVLIYFIVSRVCHHTLDASPLTSYIAVTAGVCIAVFFAIARDTIKHEKQPSMVMAGMGVYFVVLAYFAVGGANCIFDHAKPVKYNVEITGKRIYKGSKSTSYYMTIKPWGPVISSTELSISKESYYQLSEGDIATTSLYPGALGMQWYEVDK